MASHGSGHPSERSTTSHGGRLPAHVYRRRRLLAVLIVLVLVVALIWGVLTAVKALTGGKEPQQEQPAPPAASATATADPEDPFADFTPRPSASTQTGGSSGSPSPSPAATADCGSELKLTGGTDHETYTAEQKPVLELTLENTGDAPCRVEAGTKAMAFVVTSGNDQIFDSRHCATEGEDRKVTLQPGQKQDARFTWDRNRTAEGCPADQGSADPGYYSLTVSLGDRTAEPAQFVLQ